MVQDISIWFSEQTTLFTLVEVKSDNCVVVNRLCHLNGKFEIRPTYNIFVSQFVFLQKPAKSPFMYNESELIILGSKKVLLIDDNMFNIKVTSLSLNKYKIQHDYSLSILQAFEMMKNTNYDVVFMDLNMPEMNGIQAANYIRHELKLDIPIYALSSHNKSLKQEECLRAGMQGYVDKPFRPEDLASIILQHQ